MREHVQAVAIANRVRMLPHAGVFLLVEGDDDARLYGCFVDCTSCKIVVGHGKPNVLGALAILRTAGGPAAVGIVDADFMIVDGDAPSHPDVILTDLHDIEAMLLASSALERVLREYGHEDVDPRDLAPRVRERLVALGLPIGLLRWLSQREARGWLFEEMDFDRFVDDKTVALSKDKLVDEVQKRSRKGVLSPDDLWPRAEALRSSSHDPWHICCGHDLVMLLAIGLRRVWGTQRDAEVTRERVERGLRLAYPRVYFDATQLCTRLAAWQAAHPPHRVLASV